VSEPLRAVVCGSRFGRVYMAALADAEGFELAGILARGSERSRACADHYGVPLYRRPEELPDDLDLACVVVGAGLNGGPGAELAQALLGRGLHIVQEHPLTEPELAACLREARRRGLQYRLNTHYRDVEPVRVLIECARALFAEQQPLYVDVVCSIVVLNATLDVVASSLGRARPWRFEFAASCGPFKTLAGTIGGVPITLRVQNQLHPGNRDSYAHVLHRVTLGAEGGSLTLAAPHGPVLWCPRMHMPGDVEQAVRVDSSADALLDLPGARVLYGDPAPSTRELVGSLWPRATGRVLAEVRRAVLAGESDGAAGQSQLALCRMTAEVAALLGRPELLSGGEPAIAAADLLVTAAAAAAAQAHQPKEVTYVG
jgi:pyochelin biosynthetic protein PchG